MLKTETERQYNIEIFKTGMLWISTNCIAYYTVTTDVSEDIFHVLRSTEEQFYCAAVETKISLG